MQALLARFSPGKTIYLPGATGEIRALTQALAAEPERMRGVTVVSCLLPAINDFDYASLHEEARLVTFCLSRALRTSFDLGRVSVIPTSYRGIARYLRETRLDMAVAHVSLPDSLGLSSFGIAADFSPIAWRSARQRVALVNARMPSMVRGPRVSLAEADLVVECDSPIMEIAQSEAAGDLVARIAKRAAPLIPNGSTLQWGIGQAPSVLCPELCDHRDLRIRSGMVPAQAQRLHAAGALAEPKHHCAGIAAGTMEFYRYLRDSDLVALADTDVTHDVAALTAIERFYAINSALQIDLLGQVNLEWQHGQLIGGVGGAPEFARAALQSRNGGSLTLIPSTSRDGNTSRIVTCLKAPSVSMARNEIDLVVTENGVARMRNRSLDDRAAALIAVAGQGYQEELSRGWHELRATL